MISTKWVSGVYLFFASMSVVSAQSNSLVLRNPMDIPMQVAGTFGEFRSSHIHTGIDYKTFAIEGMKVYSVDDGYISRILIERGGFGNAIFITHPAGYTSVYGHLNYFRDDIARYCQDKQYNDKKYIIDIPLDSTRFAVKRGDFIALSGNSGASLGPHLHLEVRETTTQAVLNPFQLVGLSVPDTIAPDLNKVWVYPLSDSSVVSGQIDPVSFDIYSKFNEIYCYDKIGIGIEAFDRTNFNTSKTGIYKIELWVSDTLYFQYIFERIKLNEARLVSYVTDVRKTEGDKKRVIHLYNVPTVKLSNHTINVKNGVICCLDTSVRRLKICLFDDQMNKTECVFYIRGTKRPSKDLFNKIAHRKDSISKLSVKNEVSKKPVDKTAPEVSPLFNANGRADFSPWSYMAFRITDSLSGIEKYDGYIDGKWALFEYDSKLNIITYKFDSLKIGQNRGHSLLLKVWDRNKNVTEYKTQFFR